MKKLAILGLLVAGLTSLFSQDFKVPENYQFSSQEDYRNSQPTILQCIEYLENQPVSDLSDSRKKVNAYLLKWVSGTKDVKLSLAPFVMEFTKVNPNFLLVFVGGWAKYSIENKYDSDKQKGNYAGLKAIIRVYKKGNEVIKDDKILELITLDDKGTLKKWISDKLVAAKK